MKISGPAMFAFGVATALTLGGTVAYAATGGSLLIGRVNQGGVVTALNNPNGTALALNSKSGTPPLAVNRTTKVAHLNADLLDGVDAGALALKAGKTGLIFGSDSDADGLPFSARCPSGTVATGGGGGVFTAGDHLSYSGPDFNSDTGALIPNSWLVLSDSGAVGWVACYNPRGAVPGAVTNISGATGAALPAARSAKARLAVGSARTTP